MPGGMLGGCSLDAFASPGHVLGGCLRPQRAFADSRALVMRVRCSARILSSRALRRLPSITGNFSSTLGVTPLPAKRFSVATSTGRPSSIH